MPKSRSPRCRPRSAPSKQRSKFLASPVHDPDGDIHLGMNHALRVQLLHHAIGDQLVVVGRAQPLGHRLEGQQKAGEIVVLIQRRGLLLR